MEIRIDPEDRLAAGPKPSNMPMVIAVILVCSIFAGFGYKFYSDDQELQALRARLAQEAAEALAIEEAEQAAKLAERQEQRRPAPVHYDDVTSPTLEQWEREKKPERQTVFNDQNYTPKGAVNRMPPPPSHYYEQGQPRANAQVREVFKAASTPPKKTQPAVQYRNAPWRWSSVVAGSGGRERVIGGQFSYQVKNGRVDTGSVCRNEEYGSLRYRDCRKGARAYFIQACNSGNREACTASSMAP